MLISIGFAADMLDLTDEGARYATRWLTQIKARTPNGDVVLFDEDEIAALAVARSYRPPKLGRPRKHKETPR